ncbi:MRT4 protein, partial [Pseudoatta argentina]
MRRADLNRSFTPSSKLDEVTSAAEAHRILVQTYGDNALSDTTCRDWFRRFKNNDFQLEDKERSGAPKKFQDKELEQLLDEDPSQTLSELGKILQVDESTVSKRLKGLGMIQKQGHWVPYMPKSKRDKKISLTKTDRKGLVLKERIIEDVKKCVEEYNCIFLISIQNTRNTKLLDLRSEWKDSKLFFGKLRIIALGLGKSKETEVAEGIHKLANAMKNHSMRGQCGLLFTNRPKKQKKLLGKPLAVFKLLLLGVYTKKHGFKKLTIPNDARENDEEKMDMEDNDDT